MKIKNILIQSRFIRKIVLFFATERTIFVKANGKWYSLFSKEYKEISENRPLYISDIEGDWTNVIYCPNCKNDLIHSKSYKSYKDCKDFSLYYYLCTNCGKDSKWAYEIAPTPILINDDEKTDLILKIKELLLNCE